MREWILAMLGISALLLIRDMAKIISSGRNKVQIETIYDNHPQKKKIEKYAESFGQLADSFYRMSGAMGLNHLAVAEQLEEVSHLMRHMASEFYDITMLPIEQQDQLMRQLRKQKIYLKESWKILSPNDSMQVTLHLRTKKGQCIPVKEATAVLSQVLGRDMMPVWDSRSVLNDRDTVIRFVEEENFRVLYGVAKVAKDGSTVSGDSYSCLAEQEGAFTICLADGMGSGIEANRESEQVLDLLEEFLASGFSPETAARMINSALILGQKEDMFSTLDVCNINLYTGISSFLKAGAATSFIKRKDWVEALTSTSLAIGLVQQADLEMLHRKLYSEDYVIMVTDGVLDALPFQKETDMLREIIMNTKCNNPREMARIILGQVLEYSHGRAGDDMTVLVAGVWEK